jgi:hypothetical protein
MLCDWHSKLTCRFFRRHSVFPIDHFYHLEENVDPTKQVMYYEIWIPTFTMRGTQSPGFLGAILGGISHKKYSMHGSHISDGGKKNQGI